MNTIKSQIKYSKSVPESLKSMQVEFAAHIRNPSGHPPPKGIEARRMKVYSDLFYSSISSLLAGTFPITREILNDQQWEELVRDFYRPENNHTPHFPEISREFVQFLQTEYDASKFPYLPEFAHYEWVELAVEIDTRELNKQTELQRGQLLEGVIYVSPLVRLNAYHYPVHQISAEYIPESQLMDPVFLCVYRDHEDEVRFMQLNQVSAYLLEQLQQNTDKTCKEILTAMAEQMQSQNVPALIQFGMDIIEDWYQKDVIAGIK